MHLAAGLQYVPHQSGLAGRGGYNKARSASIGVSSSVLKACPSKASARSLNNANSGTNAQINVLPAPSVAWTRLPIRTIVTCPFWHTTLQLTDNQTLLQLPHQHPHWCFWPAQHPSPTANNPSCNKAISSGIPAHASQSACPPSP